MARDMLNTDNHDRSVLDLVNTTLINTSNIDKKKQVPYHRISL